MKMSKTPSIDRLALERAYWDAHPGAHLAGIDEAGRGPLAGPVVAAAVHISQDAIEALAHGPLTEMNDSKQLTEKQRMRLFEQMQTLPELTWTIGMATPQEIDQINILRATHLAMRRAVEKLTLSIPLDHLFVDGLPVKGLPLDHTAYVKGDSRSLLIACASVFAKVTRDLLCLDLHEAYPQYGFAQHKGYPTKAHIEAIKQYGYTPEHRRSFTPQALIQDDLFAL